MTLTKEMVFEEALHTLGIDGVTVEITDTDLELALRDAMRRYSRSNPKRERTSLVIDAKGIKSVNVDPDTYEITEVEFQDQLQVLETRDSLSFNMFNAWQIIGAGYGAGALGDTFEYATLVEWRNLTRREFSLQPDWYWESDVQYSDSSDTTREPRKLYFHNPTGLPLNTMYVQLKPRKLEEVNPNDEDWVIAWTTAHAKEIVGRKRNKFKTVPHAGQPLQLDGADLLEEARNEKEALRQDLANRFTGLPCFQWG